MTQEHPINPPPELVKQWREQAPRCRDGGIAREDWLMTRAAQWGADQELVACCEWLEQKGFAFVDEVRAARRPKPPSLKEQALTALTPYTTGKTILTNKSVDTIRRALEQLPDHEPSGNSR